MDDELAKTIKKLYDEQVANDRRSIVIRQTTEAEGVSNGGTAGVLIPLDGMLISVSELKFKLVFNDGFAVGENNSEGTPGLTTVIANSINKYPTYDSWVSAFPPGSVVLADNAWGAQCWDYAAGFWKAQVSRTLSTAETGAAKNAYLMAKTYNMGSEFQDVTSWSSIKKGDWVFWNWGEYGHVAMAVADANGNDPIDFYNQNNSGYPYPAGGRAISRDNISSDGFVGALRYRAWH